MNNVFLRVLSQKKISKVTDKESDKLVVEDNVGEAIHLHWRNLRLEFSIKDYIKFADNLIEAKERLNEWD